MDNRLYRGVALKACVCMALLLPVTAVADGWQQYSGVMSRYYHLDEQAFTDITCKIEVPPMQQALTAVRQQLAGMSDKLKITDTLDSYQLVYSRSTGLRFVDPTMSVAIVSEQGMSDPARVKEGIDQMEQGFKIQVQGVDTQIKGLFEGYESPKKSDITVDRVDVKGDGTVLEYKRQGVQFTDTIHGTDMHTVETIPNGNVTADSSYKTVADNELILDKFDMKMDQPFQSITMQAALTYQSLDGVVFPQEIAEQGMIQNTQNMKTQFTINVKLTGCQLHK